jgi:hypothetical protein
MALQNLQHSLLPFYSIFDINLSLNRMILFVQSKHQKHQAFEAELAANADRLQSLLGVGQGMIYI